MGTVRRFEDLEIWQLAFAVYKKISVISEKMFARQDFRFAGQIKSAAGSVMDNIAEGFERNSRFEFLNSLSISKGECGELKSQLHRSLFDKYIGDEEFHELYSQIELMIRKIASFILYLNRSPIRGLKFKNRK